MQVLSLGWEDPLEECMATHFSILVYRILMDKGAWWATVHRVTKSRTQLKQLSMYTHNFYLKSCDLLAPTSLERLTLCPWDIKWVRDHAQHELEVI